MAHFINSLLNKGLFIRVLFIFKFINIFAILVYNYLFFIIWAF